jgi:hypothetical protein
VTTQVEPARPEPPVMGCWCCGGEYAEVNLIRLGARPEVAVCLDCARYLRRRAAARRDEHRSSLQGLERVPRILISGCGRPSGCSIDTI